MKLHSKSIPALVAVAVVALVLGSVGTAVAGPALTKAKVKAIATKVVNKAAPNLTVKAAGTATTATNAANAANATNLNGLAAATYLDRVAFASSAGASTGAGTPTQLIAPLSITIPAGVNFVHVTGLVTLPTGIGDGVVWTQADAVCAFSGPDFNIRQFGNGTTQDSIGVDFVTAVTPGVHTFRLCGATSAAASMLNPSIGVVTVPGGATGGSTITKPTGAAPDRDGNVLTAG